MSTGAKVHKLHALTKSGFWPNVIFFPPFKQDRRGDVRLSSISCIPSVTRPPPSRADHEACTNSGPALKLHPPIVFESITTICSSQHPETTDSKRRVEHTIRLASGNLYMMFIFQSQLLSISPPATLQFFLNFCFWSHLQVVQVSNPT